ncbi:MAG: FAD-dependent oxidoreductase [Spirochaetes bacterium]|nr:FAD-dependent oxidoreductase [Spirochaetota bacterium]
MNQYLQRHPVLDVSSKKTIPFFWEEKQYWAKEEELISSALFANGIKIFSYHPKDQAPLGLFCANGQCRQCKILANGKVVLACMVKIQPHMQLNPLKELPELDISAKEQEIHQIPDFSYEVLIIGAGPAGLSAAIELGKAGVRTLLIDDKHHLGGKLLLQTHKFFGSVEDSFAGTRGFEIAHILTEELLKLSSVTVWMDSPAVGIFSDKKVGIFKDNNQYVLVSPQVILSATGAREMSLSFPGNTLPGVYGAGAFQTLVNRDLVKAAQELFIVGGGNVGLIAGYHALQAGIEVRGLIEAAPKVGGYKVHQDKIKRMGIPVYTGHTVVEAKGKEQVSSIVIAHVNPDFSIIPGTEKEFQCDTILIAVGLNPVQEFHLQAIEFEIPAFIAGDACEIAEASSAMFSGKIEAQNMLKFLNYPFSSHESWHKKAEILKSRPGEIKSIPQDYQDQKVFPVFHCDQEIPCNPCVSVCPRQSIVINPDNMLELPTFLPEKGCIGCLKCVAICPGLALTVVDYRKDAQNPTVTFPFEFGKEEIRCGDEITVTNKDGKYLGKYQVANLKLAPKSEATYLLSIKLPASIALQAAGVLIQQTFYDENHFFPDNEEKNPIICRCERVSLAEIRFWLDQGVTDLNQLKALVRAGMGGCGGSTCQPMIKKIMQARGIKPESITENTQRPLALDLDLKHFAGKKEDEE